MPGSLLAGWELRDKVVRPVVVNLLTAGIIALWVWFFSADIRRWFAPPPTSAEWPIYCVLEPVVNNSPDAPVEADLYVINLEATRHDARTLEERAAAAEKDPSLRPPVAVTIQITGGAPHRILGIDPDGSFNEGKGELQAAPDGNGQRWTVTVDRIEQQAILRARIRTDARRPLTSKTDLETLPFELRYARAIWTAATS